MGPGIFTKYSKQVIGGLVAFFLLLAAIPCYYWYRDPVGGESPYQDSQFLEDLADDSLHGYDWEHKKISLATAESVYSANTATVEVILRNSTDHVLLAPSLSLRDEWVLETRVDGAWHSMYTRPDTRAKHPRWEEPTVENGLNPHPAAIVEQGEEQKYLCSIERYYRTPLEPGLYRIVFPTFEVMNVSAQAMTYVSMAAEFHVE